MDKAYVFMYFGSLKSMPKLVYDTLKGSHLESRIEQNYNFKLMTFSQKNGFSGHPPCPMQGHQKTIVLALILLLVNLYKQEESALKCTEVSKMHALRNH